jgi:hypothetical protein
VEEDLSSTEGAHRRMRKGFAEVRTRMTRSPPSPSRLAGRTGCGLNRYCASPPTAAASTEVTLAPPTTGAAVPVIETITHGRVASPLSVLSSRWA